MMPLAASNPAGLIAPAIDEPTLTTNSCGCQSMS